MTTGRRPLVDVDDLAVTRDELDPVRTEFDAGQETPREHPLGSGPTLDATATEPTIRDPYFDAPRGHPLAPETRDLHDRVSALEAALPSAATNALWIRRGVKVGAGLLGLGGAVFVWALASARAHGDAEATTREREAERKWLVDTVRALDRTVAGILGELRARNPLGMLPLLGPSDEPKEPTP